MRVTIPLGFRRFRDVIEYQNSTDAQFLLDSLGRHNIIGISFVNTGTTQILTASKQSTFNDLRRSKTVVVTSPFDAILAEDFSFSPIIVGPDQASNWIGPGSTTSIILNTSTTSNLLHGGQLDKFNSSEPLQFNMAFAIANAQNWHSISFPERESAEYAIKLAKAHGDEQYLKYSDESNNLQTVHITQKSQNGLLISYSLPNLPPSSPPAELAKEAQINWFKRLDTHQQRAVSSTYPGFVKYLGVETKGSPIAVQPEKRGEYKGLEELSRFTGLLGLGALAQPTPGGVYFITNRIDHGSDKGWGTRFSDERADLTTCGMVPDTNIELGLLSPLEPVYVRNVDGCKEFLRSSFSVNRKVVLFIHGFNTKFHDAINVANRLRKEFADASVVAVTWPSRGATTLGAYLYDRGSADISRQWAGNIFASLGPGHNFSVLAHSMGNYLLVNLLREGIPEPVGPVARESVPGMLVSTDKFRIFQNLVSVAPDVDAIFFYDSIEKMSKYSDLITLYAASNDYALRISEDWNGARRAGTGGADQILIHQNMESIDVILTETIPLSTRTRQAYVDAMNPFAVDSHGYFYKDRRVLADLNELFLKGLAASKRDMGRLQPVTKGIPPKVLTYWRMSKS